MKHGNTIHGQMTRREIKMLLLNVIVVKDFQNDIAHVLFIHSCGYFLGIQNDEIHLPEKRQK